MMPLEVPEKMEISTPASASDGNIQWHSRFTWAKLVSEPEKKESISVPQEAVN